MYEKLEESKKSSTEKKSNALSPEEQLSLIQRDLHSALDLLKKEKVSLETFQEFVLTYGLDGWDQLPREHQLCWLHGNEFYVPLELLPGRRDQRYLKFSTKKSHKEAIRLVVFDILKGGHQTLAMNYFLTDFLLKQKKTSRLGTTLAELLYLNNYLLSTKVLSGKMLKRIKEDQYGNIVPDLKSLIRSPEKYKEIFKYFKDRFDDFLFSSDEEKEISKNNSWNDYFKYEGVVVKHLKSPLVPERKRGYNDKGHLPDPTKPKVDLSEDLGPIADQIDFWSNFSKKSLPNFKQFLRELNEKYDKDTHKNKETTPSKSKDSDKED